MTFEDIKYAYRCYCYGKSLSELGLSDDEMKKLQIFIMCSSLPAREIAEKTGWVLHFVSELKLLGRRWRNNAKEIRVFPAELEKLKEKDHKFFVNVVEKCWDADLQLVIEEHLKSGSHYSTISTKTLIRGFTITKLMKFTELRKSNKEVTKRQLQLNLHISAECAEGILKLIEKYSKDKKEEIRIKV